ncbi:hypothetical protein D3C75_430480 [compost metagenome]
MLLQCFDITCNQVHHISLQLRLAVHSLPRFAFLAEEQILLPLFTGEIAEEADCPFRVFVRFADHRDHPAVHIAGEQLGAVALAVLRAVYSDIVGIRVGACSQQRIHRCHAGPFTDHHEIAGVVCFLLHLCIRIHEEVDVDQSALISGAEGFQPGEVFGISYAVIHLAVFFMRDSEQILQIFSHPVRHIPLGKKRAHRLAFIFRILILQQL